MNWIHKFFNPHCLHCKNDSEDNKICNNCEYLKIQIAKLQQENERLLNNLLDDAPKTVQNEEVNTPIQLPTSRFMPWAVKKQELELRDRQIARNQAEELKKNYNQNIESLEKEILDAKIEPVGLTDPLYQDEAVNAE